MWLTLVNPSLAFSYIAVLRIENTTDQRKTDQSQEEEEHNNSNDGRRQEL